MITAEQMTPEDHAHVLKMCRQLFFPRVGKEVWEDLRIGDAARLSFEQPRCVTQDYDAETSVKFVYPGVTENGEQFEIEFHAKKMGSKIEHWEICENVSVSAWVLGEPIGVERTGSLPSQWVSVDKLTNLRVSPQDASEYVKDKAAIGVPLRVLGAQSGEFTKVRAPNGAEGWVRTKYLAIVTRPPGSTAPIGCTSEKCLEYEDRMYIAEETRKFMSKNCAAVELPIGDYRAIKIERFNVIPVASGPGGKPGLEIRFGGWNGWDMKARQCRYAIEFVVSKTGETAREWTFEFRQDRLKKLDMNVPFLCSQFKTPEARGFDLTKAFDIVASTGFHDSDGIRVHGSGDAAAQSPPRGGYSSPPAQPGQK